MCTYACNVPLLSGVCRSVQDIIDCYFTSEPPGLPAALSSRTADDVTSEITVSDVNVCTVEQSVEEFAKLLLRYLSDYIKLQKGTQILHLLPVFC